MAQWQRGLKASKEDMNFIKEQLYGLCVNKMQTLPRDLRDQGSSFESETAKI